RPAQAPQPGPVSRPRIRPGIPGANIEAQRRAAVDTATPRIAVQPGDGLVGRYGDAALLVAGHDPEEAQFVEELVAAVEAAAAEGPLSGGTLAHRLGELVLAAPSGRVASFGVVAPVDAGTLVFLHGDIGVTVDGPSGSQHLSGTEAVTWVDRLLTEPFD